MKHDDDFFGTMYDFDGDGHTDMSEEFLAFQIMDEANRQKNNTTKQQRRPIIRSGGVRLGLALAAIVLGIIGWIYFFGLMICNCVAH